MLQDRQPHFGCVTLNKIQRRPAPRLASTFIDSLHKTTDSMTREETLKGIAALPSEEGICGLIEVQQELSSVCLHFSLAIEAYYGECPDTETATSEFYDRCKALDGMINNWLGSMLCGHFSVIR